MLAALGRIVESAQQMPEVGRRFGLDDDGLTGAWMEEFEPVGVKRDAVDATLLGFGGMILAVADDRMTEGGKLHADLVLEPGHQRYMNQRGIAQLAFDLIVKLGASGFRVAGRSQLLDMAFLAEVVNERAGIVRKVAANDGSVFALRRVLEELVNERVAIARGLGEEQDTGSETVDAMDDEGASALLAKFGGEDGPRRGSVGVFGDRNRG